MKLENILEIMNMNTALLLDEGKADIHPTPTDDRVQAGDGLPVPLPMISRHRLFTVI
jgi:hypothetical protein